MKNRVLAAILASLMLLSSATACATDGDTQETTQSAQTVAESEDSDEQFPAIEKQDYEGADFRMIGWTEPGSWYYAEEYQNKAGNTAILNNTIYEMNTLVEEYLNVEISCETVQLANGHEIFEKVNPTVMSGDDIYQLCTLHAFYDYTNFITKNYALDFYSLEDPDYDRDYWNQDVMDMLSIDDRAYIGLSDLCSYSLYAIYCNKEMLTEANMEVPYEKVRNGRWTLDQFIAATTGLYVDNGDGQRNDQDIYGFAGQWDGEGNAFMQACGVYVATKNSDGEFELTLYGDRLVEMYDKLYNWSKDEGVLPWNFHSPAFTVDFKKNQSYFTCTGLGPVFLDADFQVGILPLPKYDEAQENYAHVNWGHNMVIPTTIRDKAMVGQVLELMSYYSKTLVLTKYYDEILQLRVSEAPDDRDMVELIYSTIVYDPGIAFSDGCGQLSNLVYTTCFGIRENHANITSYYQTNYKPAEKWLKSLVRKVRRYN